MFYYEGDAGEGAGGSGGNDDVVTIPEPLLTSDSLKEFGLENKEQLLTVLRQHKESNIPVAEKEKAEQLKKADFIKFSAENNLMKVEEISAFETIKAKGDRDLAFEKHLEEWKEDHPDVTDEEEIQLQAKQDFEAEYKLNSQNEKEKARGLQKMANRASELRSPLVSKHTEAEQKYNERKALEGKIPSFNKAIDELITKLTPDTLSIAKVKEGETEVPIEVDLTKKEREELAAILRTPKTFQKFESAKDLSEFEASASKKINGFLREKYFDEAVSKGYEKGKGVGTARGSNVGSEQPFAIVRNLGIPSAEGKKNAEDEVRDNDVEIRRRVNGR